MKKKMKTKKSKKDTVVWRIYGGPEGKNYIGSIETPKGETPTLNGRNRDPMDLGVMFEAHRSPPILRGPAPLGDRGFLPVTMRDRFALAALAGDVHDARSPADRAANAYLVADAMLKERRTDRVPLTPTEKRNLDEVFPEHSNPEKPF